MILGRLLLVIGIAIVPVVLPATALAATPTGYLNGYVNVTITSNSVSGWAYDSDTPVVASVQLVVDGPIGSGQDSPITSQ